MKSVFLSLILFQLGISEAMAYHQDDYTLVYERSEVVRTNERYMTLKTHTFKYNRTQAVTNFTFDLKVNFENDVKVIFQGYKFASNEYRLFPMVFDRNFCKSLKENEFGIQNIYKCGNAPSCPLKKIGFNICNWSLSEPDLPPYIPSGRYMMEVKIDYQSTEIGVVDVYFAVKRRFDRK